MRDVSCLLQSSQQSNPSVPLELSLGIPCTSQGSPKPWATSELELSGEMEAMRQPWEI